MEIREFLNQADRVFNNDGDSCDFGCTENAASEMIAYVKANFPSYPFCVVSDWVWVDINVSKEVIEALESRGLKPSVIYAHRVINDEAGRAFESVRTTLLQDFHKNCVFLSRNTAYILQGQATRVPIDSIVYARIFS